jgi:GH15 family glucan-1,4-alpha-glucosidase
MYRKGLVGNGQISAIVSEEGNLEWLCMPRPDSPPLFGSLLDPEGGRFTVECVGGDGAATLAFEQRYIDMTNILITEVRRGDTLALRMTDFCPRFYRESGIFRPLLFVRKVEAIEGAPQIRVGLEAVDGWGKKALGWTADGGAWQASEMRAGSTSHRSPISLQTNAPRTVIEEGRPLAVREPIWFAISCGDRVSGDLADTLADYERKTLLYWRNWVKHCSIPALFQRDVIRSALTLKLCTHDETGAILAAPSASLPEEVGGVRNWDYRFCWLRDAYFTLSAFHNLGHFEEMEGFLKFLLNVAEGSIGSGERLHPVYALDGTLPLPEVELQGWKGYRGSRPVRVGNQAAEHIQNDVYGELILALTPIYLDERFSDLRTRDVHGLMKYLAGQCAKRAVEADAGIWEIRDGWRPHAFTALMSWAGLERISRIRRAGFLGELSSELNLDEALTACTNQVRRCIRSDGAVGNGLDDPTSDSSLALMAVLSFPDVELCSRTVRALRKELAMSESGSGGAFFRRYIRKDDFGTPHSAFLICSYWMVQALARLGQRADAIAILMETLNAANPVGLLSEHYAPDMGTQLGNFPQAYSHVGLINAAFAVSPPWSTVL